MKLCLIGAGEEYLPLLRHTILPHILKTNDQLILIIDTLARPHADRPIDYVSDRIIDFIVQAQTQGATHIILPPVRERLFRQHPIWTQTTLQLVPLRQDYLAHALDHSLVGKIGFVGGFPQTPQLQSILRSMVSDRPLTIRQSRIKTFHTDRPIWYLSVPVWTGLMHTIGKKNLLVNTVIKHDLRYFKDSMVDTIIPLDYGYHQYDRTISNFFAKHTQHRHRIDTLTMSHITDSVDAANTQTESEKSQQSITIFITGSLHLLSQTHRLLSHHATAKIVSI